MQQNFRVWYYWFRRFGTALAQTLADAGKVLVLDNNESK